MRDNDALGAVNHERAILGHEREIAHEHFLLLHLARFFVDQAHVHPQRRGKCHVAHTALGLTVLGLVEAIVEKIQFQVLVETGNGRNLVQQLAQTFLAEPLEGLQLHFDQGRQRMHAGNARI